MNLERLEKMDQRLSAIEADVNQGRGISKVMLPFWTAAISAIVAGILTYLGLKK